MRSLAAAVLIVLAVVPHAQAKLPLHPCTLAGATGLCGRLAVPENRAAPEGRAISLRMLVLPATAAKPMHDPVFFIAGGPGGSAIDAAPLMRSAFAQLNLRHDIVLVDQRGIGRSSPLVCAPPRHPPTTTAESRAYVNGCLKSLPGDARQYGTAAATDDLEAVRKALGYGKIDLFGASYGATVAQVFVNRHPASVRTVVLDGGTLLTVPIYERLASNGDRTLDAIARACARHGECDRLYPTWRRDLPALLALLARHAPKVTVEGVGTVTLDAATAAKTIQSLTLDPSDAGQVPYVVSRAVRGRYQPLARAAVRSSGPTTTGSVPPQLIRCNEPWAVRNPDRVEADARGSDLAAAARAWAAEASATCALVPKQHVRAADWRAPRSAAPLLAVVGGADPQDPLANIEGIAKTMPNTRFVVVPGGFHTNAHLGCLPSVVAQFVDAGRAAGLQTSCVRTAVRLSWVL